MDTAILSAEPLLDLNPVGMTVPAFATACGVSRMTVYRWVRRSEVAHATVNGRLIITADPENFQPGPDDGTLSVAEFAAAAGMSRMTAYRRVEAGTVQHTVVNGKVRISTDPAQCRKG